MSSSLEFLGLQFSSPVSTATLARLSGLFVFAALAEPTLGEARRGEATRSRQPSLSAEQCSPRRGHRRGVHPRARAGHCLSRVRPGAQGAPLAEFRVPGAQPLDG